ncbi:carbohydrate ABC transporter permease [candidate division KSB1 bacterium]|nr:carbohydrate ABC transporter permease [candidate division KSB1 bacterium]
MPLVENRQKAFATKVFTLTMLAIILIFYLIPISWIAISSFKSQKDVNASPPKLFFEPTLSGYVNLFTQRSLLQKDHVDKEELSWYEQLVRDQGQVITGLSNYPSRLGNSFIIGFISTFLAITLGTLTAYGFSRFKVKGEKDWLFFILSTRMLPPVVVTIPLFLMYRWLGLTDTKFGLILLYTTFNVSFAVWLMKGFIDEIPREYEEAALVDGYTRFQAFSKIVLPQAATGIAATAVFCLITAWNEYAFALILTTRDAQTAPPFIPNVLGTGGLDWSAIAAGTVIFLMPVAIFTFLMRKHLLRGVTFGAIRK